MTTERIGRTYRRTCKACESDRHEHCVGTIRVFGSDEAWECNCDHDDTLKEKLEQSLSQFTTACTDARYGIMLDYHELKRLEDTETGTVWDKVKDALRLAEGDHARHVEKGTCIQEDVPNNSRTKQWQR